MGKVNKNSNNAPVVEVIFEIRFAGDTNIECRKNEFQDKIKHEYPNLFVPNARNGISYALEPYQFKNMDNTKIINLAINKLGYNSTNYNNYEDFCEECQNVLKIFHETFNQVDLLTRIGLRYINAIYFNRENGLIPIKRYFKLGINLPDDVIFNEEYENFNLNFTVRTNTGVLSTRLSNVEDNFGKEFMLLDFDYSKTKDLQFNFINDYLIEAHDFTNKVFNDILTDKYIKYINEG